MSKYTKKDLINNPGLYWHESEEGKIEPVQIDNDIYEPTIWFMGWDVPEMITDVSDDPTNLHVKSGIPVSRILGKIEVPKKEDLK